MLVTEREEHAGVAGRRTEYRQMVGQRWPKAHPFAGHRRVNTGQQGLHAAAQQLVATGVGRQLQTAKLHGPGHAQTHRHWRHDHIAFGRCDRPAQLHLCPLRTCCRGPGHGDVVTALGIEGHPVTQAGGQRRRPGSCAQQYLARTQQFATLQVHRQRPIRRRLNAQHPRLPQQCIDQAGAHRMRVCHMAGTRITDATAHFGIQARSLGADIGGRHDIAGHTQRSHLPRLRQRDLLSGSTLPYPQITVVVQQVCDTRLPHQVGQVVQRGLLQGHQGGNSPRQRRRAGSPDKSRQPRQ